MSWYERSAAVIKKQRLEKPQLSTPELKKFCSRHYPFAERKGWAYKAWLKAMRDAFGRTLPQQETNQQSLELGNMNEDKTVWIAKCPAHGIVRIEQKTRPTACHERIRVGAYNIRICRQSLTDVRSTRSKK